MSYNIAYHDEFDNKYVKSSSYEDLHKDLLNLFKDQCKVIEVYEDDDGAYATVSNRPTTPNNDMECEFK